MELRDNGSALLQVSRSKTDPEGVGVVLYIGKEAAAALRAIRPAEQLLDRNARVFGLSSRQISWRVQAAARAAGLGDGFTGHSGRVGMAQDLVKNGVELPALMAADRWKSAKMPARYTERQAADRGAVAHVTGSCRQRGFGSITGERVLAGSSSDTSKNETGGSCPGMEKSGPGNKASALRM